MSEANGSERRLVLADVVGTTARVLARSFPAFFVTAVLFTAPAIFVERALVEWRVDARSEAIQISTYDPYDPYGYTEPVPALDAPLRASILALLASGLAGAFCIAATQAGVLYTVVEQLAGRTASLPAALGKGVLRLPAAFGAMVLVSCVVLFGSTCLVVPAFVAACLFYFAVPAAVMEELPPFRAVARSVDLTRGNRGMLLALVGAVVALFSGARFALRTLFDAPPLLVEELGQLPAGVPPWGYFVALGLVTVLEAMILAVLSSVMYARLRERDGMDVEALAEIFA